MHLSQTELATVFSALKKVHFIGITSPFSSFCATHLLEKGIAVTASELRQDTKSAKEWLEKGVLYPGPHNADFITDDLDLVVVPNGAVPGNPEVDRLKEIDKPYVLIQELLGFISTSYKTIAITGTHGKTTTSALIVWMLHKTIGTPNFIIGDAKDKIGGDLQRNWNITKESPYLVIEACEYKRQFLARAPRPYITVITHIDLDHTDYYTSQLDYNTAFSEFIAPTQQSLIIDTHKENEREAITLSGYNKEIITVQSILASMHDIRQALPGEHNRQNIARALGTALALGIPFEQAKSAIETFPGITARFEKIGFSIGKNPIYWDYAHNPEKVSACLSGARELFPTQPIIAVYQPHNFERTHSFEKQLISALSEATVIIIPNIYSSRETEAEKSLITAKQFVEDIQANFPDKKVIFTNETAENGYPNTATCITTYDTPGAVIVLISAGDLINISSHLISS